MMIISLICRESVSRAKWMHTGKKTKYKNGKKGKCFDNKTMNNENADHCVQKYS